jgi:dihydrolipoamide dehydrogenase
MTIHACDLLVVGGGPGGYTAAIRGAQKGLKTALVEKDQLGGTCLNRGCVPTKALLDDTQMLYSVQRSLFMRGEMKVNLERIRERKDTVVEGSRTGIKNVLLGNGVILLQGKAAFTGPKSMIIRTQEDDPETITASKIILATGAEPDYGPNLKTDGRSILGTEDALAIKSIPKTLAVVGAGIRGVEFASMYHNLGTKVAIIEKGKRILPRIGWELAGRYKKALLDRRIKVLTRTNLVKAHPDDGKGVTLVLESGQGLQEIKVDRVLLTGERHPAYHGLNLEAAGLSPSEEILELDSHMQSRAEGIYLVGDAAGPPYLAHKAIVQGLRAADHILGRDDDERPLLFPHCIYGNPEVASVGMTEDEAQNSGRSVKVGEFHFMGNGRAGTIGNTEGEITIVSDSKTGEVLGAHMFGPQSTELISLAVLAMRNRISVAGIKKTVFPHPTLAEAFFEAALATDGEAIHMLLDSDEHEPGNQT